MRHRLEKQLKKQKSVNNRIDKNRGFSLIEILVVIAIVAIMAGAVGLGINFAFSKDCEKAAKSIDSQMNIVRSMSMNQSGDYVFKVESSDSAKQIQVLDGAVVNDTVKLENRVDFTFLVDGIEHTSDYIEIRFQKSNGKVKSISFSDETIESDALPAVVTIHCYNTSGKTSDVVLVTLTGKHYVE